ncbi:subtilase family serine peptidase [Skeletonema marinoi]|uniref:subtilisin n=1 Tax=Skeletonema marinoi TaxID=267567 RepID=A0AAD8Y5S0_9STRA|nr:subtilase family serine peptidase [Skeletonema marinoi]
MKVSFVAVVLAAVLLPDARAQQVPGRSSDSDIYSSNAANKQAVEEPAVSTQQNLRRRANVFSSNNNNANVDVIVVLKDEGRRRKLAGIGKAAAEENKAAASAAATSMGAVARFAYGSALYGFAASVPPGLLKQIEADHRVAYVEEDGIVQLDPMEMGEDRRRLAPPAGKGPNGGGGDGDGPAQTTPWGITRVNGAFNCVDNNCGKAWVLDSGIDLDHPDLNVDLDNSRTFLGGKSTPDDENGHGTHVAGTIAAYDNEIGVVGVAAGAAVVSVRVFDRRGSGSYSGVIAGIDYVGANCESSDVANMSLGGGYIQALNDAVVAASDSCPFVLAAGNEGRDASGVSPASANGPNIYTVSAFSDGDHWAHFSNYGSVVDYAGPGVGIHSTWKDGGYNIQYQWIVPFLSNEK